MRVLALPALFVALAACSAQPTTPQAAAAPVATAPVPVAPDSAAIGSSAESGSAQSASTSVENAATAKRSGKVPSGYRRVTRNGKEFYCRSVVTVGSRFAEEKCLTREQLDETAARTKATMNDINRSTAVCSGGSHCGGG